MSYNKLHKHRSSHKKLAATGLASAPRQSGSSHCIFRTPWSGDPRVNIQNHKGKAKSYQVKQVLLAIEQIEVNHGT